MYINYATPKNFLYKSKIDVGYDENRNSGSFEPEPELTFVLLEVI